MRLLKTERMEEVLKFLKENGPSTTNQIRDALYADALQSTVSARLGQLFYDGAIGRYKDTFGPGRGGKKFIYFAPDEPALNEQPKQEQNVAAQPRQTQTIASMIESLSDMIASQIVERVTHRIANRVVDRLVLELQERLAREVIGPEPEETVTPAVADVATAVADTVRQFPKAIEKVKPRIGIVGLMGAQADIIRQEFNSELDLRICDGQSSSKVRAIAHNCDNVVLLTKFCKHSTQDAIKQEGAKIYYANGGIESVRSALTDLYLKVA